MSDLNIPFSEILGRSRLVPLQWSEVEGTPVIVFFFEPQSRVAKHGDLESRLAGDLKGTSERRIRCSLRVPNRSADCHGLGIPREY